MNENWLERFETLIARFSYMGISADLAALTLLEAWALYLHLSRLVEG